MAESAEEKKIKSAIAHAADQVSKAKDVEEAERWQTIQNQETLALTAYRNDSE